MGGWEKSREGFEKGMMVVGRLKWAKSGSRKGKLAGQPLYIMSEHIYIRFYFRSGGQQSGRV